MNKPVGEERGRGWRQTPEWQLQECKLKEWDLPLTDAAVLESRRKERSIDVPVSSFC